MFKQILSEDEVVRERAIKFLGTKVKVLDEETIDKDAEEYLVSQCKQVNKIFYTLSFEYSPDELTHTCI
jgi:hypothetical protein